MSAQFRLVDADAPVLEHASTRVVTTYASGEVLVRTDAPRPETGAERPPHALVLEGVSEAVIEQAEQAPQVESDETYLAYVELAGPVQGEWLDELHAIGVRTLRFQPRTAYLARATARDFSRARQLDHVVRVVPLVSGLKSAPPMPEAGAEQAWVVVDDVAGEDAQAARGAALERLGRVDGLGIEGDISVAAGLGRVPVVLDARALREVLGLPFVLSVERRMPVVPEDEVAGLILAGSYDRRGRPAGDYLDWLGDRGLSGRGVTIGIVDNGVDETHEAFAGRIVSRDDGRAWHGTFVAGHAAGSYLGERDDDGFIYGLGTAPGAEIISQDNGDPAADSCRETATTSGPGGARGTIQNNSWGVGTHDPMDYRSLEATYDALVRDATPGEATARPLTVCFSAGNSGSDGLTRPKAAKNVIVTGNSENYRPGVGGADSDNIDHLFTGSHGSSHGNCGDGRVRPDLIAPGEWTASANFDSHPGQVEYISPKLTWGGGTSGASPKTAGACALLTEWWRERNAGLTPSPALLRALLVNGAEDTGFGGPVPNARQGWGRLNLANVLSEHTHHVYVDQSVMLRHRGEARTWRLRVSDPDMPVRATLVWTDPPGPLNSGTATVPAVVNAVTLSLHTGDEVYHGNHFTNGFSVAGAPPDPDRAGRDNLQNISVARGDTRSPFTIEVRALDITTNCLTGEPVDPRQDFALVVTNAYVDAGSAPLELFVLVDDTAPGAGASIDDVVVGGDDTFPADRRPTLRRGDEGEHVRHLQTLLQRAGFLTGSIDGDFGFGTQANVKSFQRSVALAADGIVGSGTWSALERAGGGTAGGGTAGGGDQTGGGSGDVRPTLRFGARGDDVVRLQTLLQRTGHLGGSADGIYGNGTLRAVQSFQRSTGLPADGVVGAATWAALEDAASGGEPGRADDGDAGGGDTGGGTAGGHDDSPPVVDRPTLRFGSRGDDVRFLQERLAASGFLSGSVDGIFGNGTLRAVRAFQRASGLGADGVVGAATWAALLAETGRGAVGESHAARPGSANGTTASLLAAAERALSSAEAGSRVVPGVSTETLRSGPAGLSTTLEAQMRRLDDSLGDEVRTAALVVVGGDTRVDRPCLRALRRLALHGGLYLVGTDADVLRAILQGLHLERGVHPRLAGPDALEALVRSTAAEASGMQELLLRTSDGPGDGATRALEIEFELVTEDTRAVIEIDVDTGSEVSVTPPGATAYRLTTSSRRKGVKLVAGATRSSVALTPADHKPWAGTWSVRIDGRTVARPFAARGFAGAGPVLMPLCLPMAPTGHVNGDGSGSLVCVRAEDGAGIVRLRVEPAASAGTAIAESGGWPLERHATSSRLDTLDVARPRAESGEPSTAGALDVAVHIGGAADEPGLLDLRLSVEGRTARGESFGRVLRFAPYRLVPRGTWQRRCGQAAERVVEGRVLAVRHNRAGEVIGLRLRSVAGPELDLEVTERALGAALARLELRDGSYHAVLSGTRLVRLLHLLTPYGAPEVFA